MKLSKALKQKIFKTLKKYCGYNVCFIPGYVYREKTDKWVKSGKKSLVCSKSTKKNPPCYMDVCPGIKTIEKE